MNLLFERVNRSSALAKSTRAVFTSGAAVSAKDLCVALLGKRVVIEEVLVVKAVEDGIVTPGEGSRLFRSGQVSLNDFNHVWVIQIDGSASPPPSCRVCTTDSTPVLRANRLLLAPQHRGVLAHNLTIRRVLCRSFASVRRNLSARVHLKLLARSRSDSRRGLPHESVANDLQGILAACGVSVTVQLF